MEWKYGIFKNKWHIKYIIPGKLLYMLPISDLDEFPFNISRRTVDGKELNVYAFHADFVIEYIRDMGNCSFKEIKVL